MPTAIILAAGLGTRFGGQKLLTPIDGRPMLARVLDAAAHLPTVVVAPPELAPHIAPARFVENTAPERGMSYSLRLANATIDPTEPILVLLADMPYITRDLIDRILTAAGNADVAYPIRNGIGGHPVLFSASARLKIPTLPDGDTIKSLRDAPGLNVAKIPTEDPAAHRDIDTPSQA
jgi:molybdenum cofactor cytidylyltransferase